MSNERGFTVPELVVTTIGMVVLFGIAALMLAPATHANERLNAQRKLGVAAIAQGLNRYIADAGEAPPFIPVERVAIGNAADDEYDLCMVFASQDTAQDTSVLPLDPKQGVVVNEDGEAQSAPSVDCDDAEVVYSSGYSIAQDASGTVLVSTTFTDGQMYSLPVPKQ